MSHSVSDGPSSSASEAELLFSNPFPWSAVLGQERLKLALLLCAIDPAIGGVLIRGPRGVAKTTLARAFAELLPGRFVELPLGATEERVTGTLDLGKVLQRAEVQFSPGLLARAHEGVLYVDEVNLLPDALVDLLLDAAATGKNVVERDAVSHAHAARFVLVGTMNPEEGELRPQFVDRFGLSVLADSELAPPQRTQIVLRRLEFERDPAHFVARFADEQRALAERCARARQRAAGLGFEGPGLERVAELCHAARVEGVRADLAMLRAARAYAVWQGRDTITASDVDVVAELALAHRRRDGAEPPPRGGSGTSGAPTSGSGTNSPATSGSGSAASGTSSGGGTSGSRSAASGQGGSGERAGGERGRLPPVPVRGALVASLPAELGLAGRPRLSGPTLPGARRSTRRRGGTRRAGIDWVATLLAHPRPTQSELCYRRRPSAPVRLWLVALDCSASMLQSGALRLAKGVAQALSQAADRARAHVALISFSAERAHTELSSSKSTLERAISELGGGGGTPLRRALLAALAVGRRPAYRDAAVEKRLFLLSDGRSREQLDDLRERRAELAPILLDCERSRLRLGRARGLAASLGAGYVQVDT